MFRLKMICLFLIVYANDVSGKKLRREDCDLQSEDEASGTLVTGKFIMLPILAGVGLKFLVLLPIVLSKIALLGILSFVSSNLSLLVSAVMGVRSYFFEDKPEEDYDYDSRHKSRYESYESDQNDDHRYQKSNHDHHDRYAHRYKGYESSHPGYTSYHSDYKAHDYHAPKKRFRPFKLLGKIKDVIKDLFHKSRNHQDYHREYDNHYKHHSHDLRDDYDEYYHKEREARLKDSEHSVKNYHSAHTDASRVPQDWSVKGEVSRDAIRTEKSEDEGQPKTVVDSSGLTEPNSDRTLSKIGFKVNENEPKFKEPFIVFGLRPQTVDSESEAAFYATDYQITDFNTEPQADTSK